MNPHTIKRMFPNASAATLAANAGDYGIPSGEAVSRKAQGKVPADLAQSDLPGNRAGEVPALRHRRGKMNRTEASMAARLDADEYEWLFEPLTLRWGATENDAPMRYTPDFVQFTFGKWTLIECKGAHERSRDIVRFRGCRAEWQHRFNFEYWMLKKGTWTRLE